MIFDFGQGPEHLDVAEGEFADDVVDGLVLEAGNELEERLVARLLDVGPV